MTNQAEKERDEIETCRERNEELRHLLGCRMPVWESDNLLFVKCALLSISTCIFVNKANIIAFRDLSSKGRQNLVSIAIEISNHTENWSLSITLVLEIGLCFLGENMSWYD